MCFQLQKFLLYLTITLLICWPVIIKASIVGVSGDVEIVFPPPSVEVGQFESNTQISVFPEQQNVLLNTPLIVDVLNPGFYGPNADLNIFPQGAIAQGTLISSYYFHADQIGTVGSTSFSGTVTFDTDILGIAFTEERLSSTRIIMGLSTTAYDSAQQTNVVGRDQIIISSDRRTVTFNVNQGIGADNLRVITAVPLPAGFVLLFSGLIVLMSILHRGGRLRAT